MAKPFIHEFAQRAATKCGESNGKMATATKIDRTCFWCQEWQIICL